MQTFLPYRDFGAACAVLDDRRLGKQRVETYQILRALTFPAYAWKNHPAVRMWRGFVPALVAYGVANCDAWTARGRADTVRDALLAFTGGHEPDLERLRACGQLPPWLGTAALHRSHRSSLVRKDPTWYRPFFPAVPDDLPYERPDGLYPWWPMDAAPPPAEAAAALIEGTARALRDGRDVIWRQADLPPGSPAHLAAQTVLTLSAPALWISEHAGEPSGPGEIAEERDAMRLSAETITAARQSSQTGRRAAVARPAVPRSATARSPTQEDLAVVVQEASRFRDGTYRVVVHCPSRLAEPGVRASLLAAPPSVIVLATADHAACDAVSALRSSGGGPPVLTLPDGQDPPLSCGG